MDIVSTLLLLFDEGPFGPIKEHSSLFVMMEVFGLGGLFPRANKEKYHVEFLGYVGFLYRSFGFSLSDRLSQHRGL